MVNHGELMEMEAVKVKCFVAVAYEKAALGTMIDVVGVGWPKLASKPIDPKKLGPFEAPTSDAAMLVSVTVLPKGLLPLA